MPFIILAMSLMLVMRPPAFMSPGFMLAGQGPAYLPSIVVVDALMLAMGGENVARTYVRYDESPVTALTDCDWTRLVGNFHSASPQYLLPLRRTAFLLHVAPGFWRNAIISFCTASLIHMLVLLVCAETAVVSTGPVYFFGSSWAAVVLARAAEAISLE